MIIIKINSITELDSSTIVTLLEDTIKERFQELIIKCKVTVYDCTELYDDNCNYYIVAINSEFDVATKTEEKQYMSNLTDLSVMTLNGNIDTVITSIFSENGSY